MLFRVLFVVFAISAAEAKVALYACQYFAVGERFTLPETNQILTWVAAHCELDTYVFGTAAGHFSCHKSIPWAATLNAHGFGEGLTKFFRDRFPERSCFVMQVLDDVDNIAIVQYRMGSRTDLCPSGSFRSLLQ
jgi:hypothetical protein